MMKLFTTKLSLNFIIMHVPLVKDTKQYMHSVSKHSEQTSIVVLLTKYRQKRGGHLISL